MAARMRSKDGKQWSMTDDWFAVSREGGKTEGSRVGNVAQVVKPVLLAARMWQCSSKSPEKDENVRGAS